MVNVELLVLFVINSKRKLILRLTRVFLSNVNASTFLIFFLFQSVDESPTYRKTTT